MTEFKQIRLNPEIRALLDDYKMQNESYSIAIGRLFKENALLKENQERLMKMAMRTENSIALPNEWHRTSFVIEMMALHFDFKSDDEAISFFKEMMGDSLDGNASKSRFLIKEFLSNCPEYKGRLGMILEWLDENYPESYNETT